ncbi:hypothetical protein Cgig2_016457 [Carnegiea gigantea]|uniref:Uncharacterized protein n=1 Tax=Carnegiea gigantea TaxID=171969 RepID=A0A9Q1K649_9CARY|nr:hypothetical protein Cgig2_016457 [Carnegiea gigantea]
MCRVIGKVVDPYSGTVVGGATSGRNGWRWCCYRRSLNHVRLQSTYVPNSHILLHCAHIGLSAMSTPPALFFWMFPAIRQPEIFTGRRLMFTVSCPFDILIILDSQLSPHPHSCLAYNVQSVSGTPLGKLTDYSCRTLTFCSYCLLSCQYTPTPVCILMLKFIGTLPCLSNMRPMFTVVNHGVQVEHPWKTDRLKL